MCGLAGTYAPLGDRADRDLLLTMAGELRHRGPDGTGLYLDGRFGMVNTRLAIVDPYGGEQPLPNEDGRFWVMQNGEIYNHVELRQELEILGHRFATTCDTEVIVHAFEEWGVDCLKSMNGDFAFALWDHERGELFLARDRFGVRPLFLTGFGGGLTFASEIKALLRHPAAKRQLDPLGLRESFTTWAISPEHSAFAGVRELPPAHFLRIGRDGHAVEQRWWDLDFGSAARGDSSEELAEELRALLEDSTRLRLRADVPVGAYLSGGLDSSSVAALARTELDQPLVSFGISFADARFDERTYQRRMATELHTDLHQLEVGPVEIASMLPEAIRLAEQPTLRTALAPMLRLSRLVRDTNLKVVLSGEGADELFAGYDIFKEAQLRRFWARDPGSVLRPLLFRRLYPHLARHGRRADAFMSAFFGRGLLETNDPLYSHQVRFANGARLARLFDPGLLRASGQSDPLARLRGRLPADFGEWSPLAKAQYLEVTTFLSSYLLHAQGDRMMMGNSIEGRFPFLDYRVAEFATTLPDRLRLCGLQEKYLLRKAMAPLLPPEIALRRKVAYRAPIAQVLAGRSAPDYVSELFTPGRLREAGIFDPTAAARVLAKAKQNAERGLAEADEMALVGITSVMLLHEQLVARPQLAAPTRATKVVQGDESPSLTPADR